MHRNEKRRRKRIPMKGEIYIKKKAVLALTLAGLVALQVPMVALADDYTITEDKTVSGDWIVSNKQAIALTGTTAHEVIVTNGNVTNNSAAITVSTQGSGNHKVTIDGGNVLNLSNNLEYSGAISNGGGTIEVKKGNDGENGNVTGSTQTYLVRAYTNNNEASVSIDGAVTNNGTGGAISVREGASVSAGSATNTSDSRATVLADDALLTVSGAVTNNGTGNAILATNDATVKAGSATNGVVDDQSNNRATINAENSTVIIEAKDGVDGATGDVTNTGGNNSAVWVQEGATVVIEGTAKNNAAGQGTVMVQDSGKLIVYKIENTADESNLIDIGCNDNIYYIIKGMDSEGIDLTKTTGLTSQTVLAGTTCEKTYQTAKGEEEIKVAVESGYEVKAGTIQVTKNADGTYSIKVPVGGGVTLETIKKAVEAAQAQEEEKKATVTGSEGNAVSGGSWNCGPGETWTYRNNGIFKDTWGYITLSNGRTGWFWFDKSGVMATGWKEINGKWYYFNEAHDGAYGMMLANTTTPDGKKVGADGAMIQ